MRTISEIKDILCQRIKRFDDNEHLSVVLINGFTTIDEIFDYIMSQPVDEILIPILDNNTITVDVLEDLFGVEYMKTKRVYTTGENTVFGGYTFYAFGDAVVNVASDAIVYAFNHSVVNARQNALLYMYNDSYFSAVDNVCVYAVDNVSGELRGNSKATIRSSRGDIRLYDRSSAVVNDSRNIYLWNNSCCEAYGNSYIRCMEQSRVEAYDTTTVSAFHDTCVECHNKSTVCPQGEKVQVELYGYSECNVIKAYKVTAYENSIVTISDKCVNLTKLTLYGRSNANVYIMGLDIKCYESSILKDDTDSYLNPFDNAIIIWMNKHLIWNTQMDDTGMSCIKYE